MSSPTRHARLMELFDEGCELPRPEVKVWLANLTGFDAGLREELAAMLDADDRSEVFNTKQGAALLARELLDSAVAKAPKLPDAQSPEPTQLGEYEVLAKLGAGGMGSVYRARQKSPERVVALKTLHPWLVSPAALERFRFESQALASLTHPGIPPVYAVGQHEGLVYFAMELIEGLPLTKYAASKSLDVRARVELLARVAEAVHHAHLRGFVHRDLKPDNVRVTSEGQPKVLDFGIAAGLGSLRAEVAGTPSYMSPEQFDSSAGVDVRTDVYALGVMLFELLTGQVPIVPHSPKLGTLRELKQHSAPRLISVEPKLGRELDAIVARALAVRVEQRYGSAAELATELRRWLQHEPVEAVGGGATYRAGRFVRRNRALVSLLSLLLLALIIGVSVSTKFFLDAKAEAKKAELEASRAKTSAEFLASVFAEADSDNAGGRGATIGVAIDHAVEKLEKEEIDPHVEAFLRASLANTYVGLGEWQHAKTQALAAAKAYEKGQLPDDEALSEVLRVVSEVQVETGAMKEGVEAAERSLKLEEGFHPGVPHDHTAYSLHVAAIAHRFDNDVKGALELHHRAVAMERALLASTGNSYLADALDQSCLTLVTFGRYDEARTAVTESLAMNEKKFGREHQVFAITLAHLGYLELNQGNLEAARKAFIEVNAVRKKTLGPQHMRYAQGLHNAAQVEVLDGKFDAAEPLLDECLEVAKKAFGENTGRYAWLELLRAQILLGHGKAAEALVLIDKDLELIRAHYGEERDATLQALVIKAKVEKALGLQTDTAAKAKALGAKMYGEDHPLYRRQADAL
ncbi:MAG: serine/threonine-protein kinase [Archangium sp.]